ncbi:JAB-like toxin 1 domain-containing protein [uncultured Chryseobacterium sp.]|uniref:JAB-like toxin 1 domain-containing protein n=1 Tax=uncultured Chryseobacterium sp. TaxID=259322 RepID=UPI0025D22E00|nr:JAB-like toxin 1 domain-containing protein [uncultured Chryseobacterium sp.]
MGMYDYGARFYMADIGRWGVIDPLAEMYHSMSSYHMSGNNPIFYIDSNGMNYDDYGVDNNGNVTLIQKTEDKFDRLYKAKSDSEGNAILDSEGKAQKAIEGEGKENKDYVKVYKSSASDGTIISQLQQKDSYGISFGQTKNSNDAKKIFQFAADNTNVEWSIGGFNMGSKSGLDYLVGTNHKKDRSVVPYDFGLKGHTFNNIFYMGHTHPYSRHPQQHDLSISNPDAYNFIYYTNSGNGGERENWFMPYSINRAIDGTLKWIVKPGAGNIKLPNLIK